MCVLQDEIESFFNEHNKIPLDGLDRIEKTLLDLRSQLTRMESRIAERKPDFIPFEYPQSLFADEKPKSDAKPQESPNVENGNDDIDCSIMEYQANPTKPLSEKHVFNIPALPSQYRSESIQSLPSSVVSSCIKKLNFDETAEVNLQNHTPVSNHSTTKRTFSSTKKSNACSSLSKLNDLEASSENDDCKIKRTLRKNPRYEQAMAKMNKWISDD